MEGAEAEEEDEEGAALHEESDCDPYADVEWRAAVRYEPDESEEPDEHSEEEALGELKGAEDCEEVLGSEADDAARSSHSASGRYGTNSACAARWKDVEMRSSGMR